VQIATDYLEHAGFAVIAAHDGAGALEIVRARRPDLVVLDLGLPRLVGIEVARQLRRESTIPIIMLTARVEESDRLLGLEIGADDYITKPFSPRELVARVKTVLRRVDSAQAAGDVRQIDQLTIAISRITVNRGRRRLAAHGCIDGTASCGAPGVSLRRCCFSPPSAPPRCCPLPWAAPGSSVASRSCRCWLSSRRSGCCCSR